MENENFERELRIESYLSRYLYKTEKSLLDFISLPERHEKIDYRKRIGGE